MKWSYTKAELRFTELTNRQLECREICNQKLTSVLEEPHQVLAFIPFFDDDDENHLRRHHFLLFQQLWMFSRFFWTQCFVITVTAYGPVYKALCPPDDASSRGSRDVSLYFNRFHICLIIYKGTSVLPEALQSFISSCQCWVTLSARIDPVLLAGHLGQKESDMKELRGHCGHTESSFCLSPGGEEEFEVQIPPGSPSASSRKKHCSLWMRTESVCVCDVYPSILSHHLNSVCSIYCRRLFYT